MKCPKCNSDYEYGVSADVGFVDVGGKLGLHVCCRKCSATASLSIDDAETRRAAEYLENVVDGNCRTRKHSASSSGAAGPNEKPTRAKREAERKKGPAVEETP